MHRAGIPPPIQVLHLVVARPTIPTKHFFTVALRNKGGEAC